MVLGGKKLSRERLRYGLEAARSKYGGFWEVGTDKDQKVAGRNSESGKNRFFMLMSAGRENIFAGSLSGTAIEISTSVIGEIAFKNRVENSIAIPDPSDDFSTFLKIMSRRNQGIQDS